ncbi:DUF2599 domain-containing protein [Cellulomonas triticagri]|uniref:DUF2599 domain-containing protein n=1 Tax=Cellulomonas triticagri TaxID=2483352 RepID=UPI0018F60297|nr:DUF2599 domain-containing protein [Cellulomonas triticagri]
MTRSRRPARAPFAGAVVAVSLLAACTGPSDPAPTPSTPAEATSPATAPGGDQVRAEGTVVRLGDVDLWVRDLGGTPSTAPAQDEDLQLSATTPAAEDATAVPVLDLAGAPGTTVEVLGDDSVVVRDGAGTVVAGVGAPVLDDAARTAGARVEVVQDAADAVTWRVTVAAAPVPAASVGGILSASALGSATWRDLDDEGGRSLAVVPTTWARTGSLAAEELLWARLAAQEPEAATQGVRDQLTCHVIGAPDKASWNLEPWRPDVGLLDTLAARCNPS